MDDHRHLPRVRLLDTARVLVVIALRADPRGATAADLYRRIQPHCARSSVYEAIADLALDRFITSGPATIDGLMARLDALAPGGVRREATLQLTASGMALAQDLHEALQAVGLRAFAGTQETAWSRATWKEFGGANRHTQAQIVCRLGFPKDDIPKSMRQYIHNRYRMLRGDAPVAAQA